MNMKTNYLGLQLEHPLMVGASPLGNDLDMVRRLEDAGSAAITLPSLFEEQITREQFGTLYDLEAGSESFAEATTYFANIGDVRLGPDNYREKFRLVLGTERTPDQVLAAAEADLGAVRARMLELAGPLHRNWFPEHGAHADPNVTIRGLDRGVCQTMFYA